jgi:hypothetical protein
MTTGGARAATSGHRLAIGGALAAGALAAVLGAPGLADARPVAALEDDQFVSAPIDTLDNRIQRMKQTGAKYTHVDVFWNEVAPNRPSRPGSNKYDKRTARNHRWDGYDWTRVDTIMTELKRRKIVPIMQVYSSTWFSNGGRRQAPLSQGGFRTQYIPFAPNPSMYADFMYALAKRYNGKQRVTLNGKTVRLPRARHFEHWNEANLKSFFRKGRGSNVGAYAQLVAKGAPAVDAAQRGIRPKTLNLGGTFGPRSSGGNGNIGALTWWKKLLRNKQFRRHIDIPTGHFYPAAAPLKQSKAFPSWSTLNLMIEETNKYANTRRKKIMITEAGYTTARTPFRSARVTFSQQARYIKQIFNTAVPREEREAQRNSRRRGISAPRDRVALIVIFNMTDNAFWPGGLWTADFRRKKPAFNAFRGVARRSVPGAYRSTLRV